MTSTMKLLLASTALGAAALAGCGNPNDVYTDQEYTQTDAETAETGTAQEDRVLAENDTFTERNPEYGPGANQPGPPPVTEDPAMPETGIDPAMDPGDMPPADPEDARYNTAGVETSIVEVASERSDLSTMVAALEAADLEETLSEDGPYTVFAPPNSAFDALPEGTLDTLMQADQKERLSEIVKYHVVEGELHQADLAVEIVAAGGTYDLQTLDGETLTASLDTSGNVVLTDATGATATIVTPDIDADNGIVHTISTVVMPGS